MSYEQAVAKLRDLAAEFYALRTSKQSHDDHDGPFSRRAFCLEQDCDFCLYHAFRALWADKEKAWDKTLEAFRAVSAYRGFLDRHEATETQAPEEQKNG